MKVKQLLNCNICDENDEVLGKAADIMFNAETGKCLPVLNGTVYDVERISASKACVVASNLQTSAVKSVSLINKEVYDALGNKLGVIADATFYQTTMKLRRIVCDNGEQYGKSRIFAVGDIVIIKVAKPKKAKATKRTEPVKQAPVKALPIKTEEPAEQRRVRRRYGDFSFLLGKKADKTITNFFNEVMIRAGEIVTYEILRQAKMSGKLIELCLHVK